MAPAACGPERNVGTFSATSVTQLNSQLNSGRRPDGPRCHEGYGRSSGLPLGPGETTSPSILPDGLRGRPHACRRDGVHRSVEISPDGSGARSREITPLPPPALSNGERREPAGQSRSCLPGHRSRRLRVLHVSRRTRAVEGGKMS